MENERPSPQPSREQNLFWTNSQVTAAERAKRYGHVGRVVWFTGLSGAGKSTLASEVERRLFRSGRSVFLLDGDNLRRGLCTDLGFSAADRSENVRRASEVAKLFADAGIICLAAFISPLRRDREHARNLLPKGRFTEIFVDAPIEVCQQRDTKGLYARAARGEIPEFTGVSAPYEPPTKADLVVHTDRESIQASVTRILAFLAETDAVLSYDI